MKSTVVLLVLMFCAVIPGFAQDPSKGAPLTNADVLTMLKGGLSAEIVVAKIRSSSCDFDTAPQTLSELKNSGVPDPVMLAMVQAPSAKRDQPVVRVETEKVYLKCDFTPKVIYSATSLSSRPVASSECGDTLAVLGNEVSPTNEAFLKVRTESGVEGYLFPEFVTKTKPEAEATKPAPVSPADAVSSHPASIFIPANELRAVAWRGVPWVTTSYYQQRGSATTNCSGSGTWFGNMSQADFQCDTQYTPAQNVPLSWSHYTIYNLVETSTSYMVIACTRNVVWSKCSYLEPGSVFPFGMKNGKVLVLGQRGGKSKDQTLDYEIVSSQIKTQ